MAKKTSSGGTVAKPASAGWYSVRMRPEDKGDELVAKLQALLGDEKGAKISISDTVRIALEEAIAARKKVRK